MAIISIIMPCYNGEKYIKSAIESVISQTYSEWELLIIDNNSTDNSANIISSYSVIDSRIKLLVCGSKSGTPAAPRNVGIEASTGKYIAFLDCDDIWLPTKLESQLPFFNNNNCAVVFSYYKKMDENGNVSDNVITSPKQVTYKQLLNGDCIGNLTGMYDISKVGKVYQKEIHAEDYLMWLEILHKNFIAMNTNTVEGLYRVSTNSTSGNKLKSAMWNWNIFRNELHLSLISAIFHFCNYMIRGVLKYIK